MSKWERLAMVREHHTSLCDVTAGPVKWGKEPGSTHCLMVSLQVPSDSAWMLVLLCTSLVLLWHPVCWCDAPFPGWIFLIWHVTGCWFIFNKVDFYAYITLLSAVLSFQFWVWFLKMAVQMLHPMYGWFQLQAPPSLSSMCPQPWDKTSIALSLFMVYSQSTGFCSSLHTLTVQWVLVG